MGIVSPFESKTSKAISEPGTRLFVPVNDIKFLPAVNSLGYLVTPK